MGDEIFSVYLTPADYSKLAYAKLDLPASPWKLLDALDKVRLPEGDSLYLEITDYRDFEVLRSSLVCSATNLLELNDLAERLSRLNEVQRIAFEGLVRVDFQKQESITLKRLRDLAESVDCCHVVESVVSDGQLGRFYAENGFVPEVEGMSDAAFELLDFEKVGKMARMGECGVYVPSGISGLGGYVVQHSDLKSAPEITLNQPVEPAYTIHLRLTAHHDKVAPTMSARYGTGGNNVPLVAQRDDTFCITGNAIDRQPMNGGNGIGYQQGIAYTLTATDHHAVFSRQRVDVFKDDDVASTQSARQHKDATDLVMNLGEAQNDSKPENETLVLLIRRLTPLECERLQGFPDGWTDIEGASDSARYKALGNSVAIPCVDYVLQGIAWAITAQTA